MTELNRFPVVRLSHAAAAGRAAAQMHSQLRKAADAGRNGDTMIAHINPQEAQMLKASGGSGTVNPQTGLPEFGGGGGTINGAGGSGNVSGGGVGNAGGGGKGNNPGKSVDRVNSELGQQHPVWGNRPMAEWGAPYKANKYGVYTALSAPAWSSWTDQVNNYNAAANKWNKSASQHSFANFVNNAAPMGFSMQAPDLNKPKTYVEGDYHLGLNPAQLAGSILGPYGSSLALGPIAGKVYTALGGQNAMLGGGPVPSGWDAGGASPANGAPAGPNSPSSQMAGNTGGGPGQFGAQIAGPVKPATPSPLGLSQPTQTAAAATQPSIFPPPPSFSTYNVPGGKPYSINLFRP